jgi:hypothetical protein
MGDGADLVDRLVDLGAQLLELRRGFRSLVLEALALQRELDASRSILRRALSVTARIRARDADSSSIEEVRLRTSRPFSRTMSAYDAAAWSSAGSCASAASLSMAATRRPFRRTSVRMRPSCSRGGPTRVAVSSTQSSGASGSR